MYKENIGASASLAPKGHPEVAQGKKVNLPNRNSSRGSQLLRQFNTPLTLAG